MTENELKTMKTETTKEVRTILIGFRPENDFSRFRILATMSNDSIIPDLLFDAMVKSHVAMLQLCINWEKIEVIEHPYEFTPNPHNRLNDLRWTRLKYEMPDELNGCLNFSRKNVNQ